MKKRKWGFHWAFLYLVAMTASISSLLSTIGDKILAGASNPLLGLLGLIPVAVWLFMTCAFVMYQKNLLLLECLNFLGFKKPDEKQFLLVVIIVFPMSVGIYLTYEACFRQLIPLSFWAHPLIVSGALFLTVLFEEVVFRGFFFQFLRSGRSFLSAALQSTFLWSLSHLSNLSVFGRNDWKFVLIQMEIAILIGIPIAYVFEKTGNNIWGSLAIHLALDSTLLVGFKGHPIYDLGLNFEHSVFLYRGGGIILSILLTYPAVRWIYSNDAVKKRKYWMKIFKFPNPAFFWILLIAVFEFFLLFPIKQNWAYWARISKYKMEIETNPKDASAYLRWGQTLMLLGRSYDAVEKFKKAVSINEEDGIAYLDWGNALSDMKKYEEAKEKYEKAIRLDPSDAFVQTNAKESILKIDEKIKTK